MLLLDELQSLQALVITPFSKEQRKVIGNNIQLARKSTVYTQADMAEVFKTTERRISRIETGESPCSIEMMLSFCKLYKCKMADILPAEFAPYISVFDALLALGDDSQIEAIERAIMRRKATRKTA